MTKAAQARGLFVFLFAACGFAWAGPANTDPLAAVDLNRNAIIADMVESFGGGPLLKARLEALRADKLLAASLTSTAAGLESILAESAAMPRSAAGSYSKAFGDSNRDLVYTALTPCRLVDTRGFGAPIVGGAFTPNERRSYVPGGLCSIPASGVSSMMVSFTTQNLTPASGGYLAILAPAAPVTTTVDVFNLNSEWSASITAVATGAAGQFDVFVSTANAHFVVDILGYFGPPPPGAVVTAMLADGAVTAGKLASNGCTGGQVLQYNGSAWTCAGGVRANSGLGNMFVGPFAGNSATTGGSNTGSGVGALNANTTGNQNTATGDSALNRNTTGNSNTAVGANALTNNVSGNQNTATGTSALQNNFGGSDNTATGAFALQSNTFGGKNTAVGSLALRNNTTGNTNAAVGWNSLGSNTSGFRNTAIGESAMFANTTGNDNTASGVSALAVNTTGAGNAANGSGALLLNATGSDNTAMGSATLVFNELGSNNTAVGKGALYTAGKRVTAGSFITGATYTIRFSGTTDFTLVGAANSNVGTVFIATGAGAGSGTAAGQLDNNTALGANAGSNLQTGTGNIAIGYGAWGLSESNTTRIGQAQTRTFIGGIRGVTTGVGNAVAVMIDSDGQLGTVSSSRRVKDDIADMGSGSRALMELRPVTFHYKAEEATSERRLQYGLIAEEVAKVYPGLVAHSADGKVETVMYQYLPSMLLNEYQKQQQRIEVLERQAERLARLVERLEASAQAAR